LDLLGFLDLLDLWVFSDIPSISDSGTTSSFNLLLEDRPGVVGGAFFASDLDLSLDLEADLPLNLSSSLVSFETFF